MNDADWQADLARCHGTGSPWLREQSLWALWVYRFGRRVDARPAGWRRRIATRVYWLLFRAVETATGISLPKETRIGPGLRIWHFGGIFVNPGTSIGAGCTLRQGVTLGNRSEGGPCPTLDDGVELGAYAQVLGGVRLGAGCRVGAMSVVLNDVPAGATAVGNPARILGSAPTAAAAPPQPQQEHEQHEDRLPGQPLPEGQPYLHPPRDPGPGAPRLRGHAHRHPRVG